MTNRVEPQVDDDDAHAVVDADDIYMEQENFPDSDVLTKEKRVMELWLTLRPLCLLERPEEHEVIAVCRISHHGERRDVFGHGDTTMIEMAMDPLKPAAHHVRREGQRGRQGHKCRELRTFCIFGLDWQKHRCCSDSGLGWNDLSVGAEMGVRVKKLARSTRAWSF